MKYTLYTVIWQGGKCSITQGCKLEIEILTRTYFEICDPFSDGHHPAARLMTHHHWLFHNKVSNPSLHPVMDVTATNSDRVHHQEHLYRWAICEYGTIHAKKQIVHHLMFEDVLM